MLTFAIEAYKRIIRAERRMENLQKELKGFMARLSKEDMAKYETSTRLWEQGQ